MSDLDKSKIPKGDYCYTWVEEPSEKNRFRGKVNLCPYWKAREINGVEVPWCDYLNLGGIPACGDWKGWKSDDTEKKLIDFFGSEEKMEKELPLSLLFEQCKECGENYEIKI